MKLIHDLYSENIKLTKNNFDGFDIFYNNHFLCLETPKLKIPFGLEKEYSNFILKLQLTNIKNDENMEKFLDKIKQIEQYLSNFLDGNLRSQIRFSEDYDPILITKISKIKNKITTEVLDEKDIPVNIFSLKKYDNLKCIIYLDKIWKYNNTYFYKWHVHKICVL